MQPEGACEPENADTVICIKPAEQISVLLGKIGNGFIFHPEHFQKLLARITTRAGRRKRKRHVQGGRTVDCVACLTI